MLPTLRTLLHRRLSHRIPSSSSISLLSKPRTSPFPTFSTTSGSSGGGGGDNDNRDTWDKPWTGADQPRSEGGGPISGFDWGEIPSWSTGLTKDHFDGGAVGHQVASVDESPKAVAAVIDEEDDLFRALDKDNRENKKFVDGWKDRMMETYKLLKQVREPGARGEYLKDSEKAEMYRLHKENPEVYTVERLAKDYRIMRQRVHAILWLKEMEEEEEKKLGKPLDDSVEILLDNFPE